MKQIKPETGISKKAMELFCQIIADLFERIMDEGRKLTLFSKKSTLSSKEIETTIKLLFKGELAKHAINEGRQSIAKFIQKERQWQGSQVSLSSSIWLSLYLFLKFVLNQTQ